MDQQQKVRGSCHRDLALFYKQKDYTQLNFGNSDLTRAMESLNDNILQLHKVNHKRSNQKLLCKSQKEDNNQLVV